jgi:hypothetical protein
MTNLIRPGSLITNRGLSAPLWRDCRRVGSEGLFFNEDTFFYDDFKMLGKVAPAISGATAGFLATEAGAYQYYLDTATSACSIAGVAAERDGTMKLTTGATDNHEIWVQAGGGGNLGIISSTAGTAQRLWYEAKFKVGQIGNTYNMFLGLGEENLAAADTVTDAGALADKDLLGFWVLEAAGATLNFGYRKAGQAVQTTIAAIQTLVADTWYKVGLMYDPNAPAAKKIRVFLNGREQTTYITAANLAAATFPLDQGVSPLFGVKNQAATAINASLDFLAFSQEAA